MYLINTDNNAFQLKKREIERRSKRYAMIRQLLRSDSFHTYTHTDWMILRKELFPNSNDAKSFRITMTFYRLNTYTRMYVGWLCVEKNVLRTFLVKSCNCLHDMHSINFEWVRLRRYLLPKMAFGYSNSTVQSLPLELIQNQ